MTYGWQIGEANDASGGRYIIMREGVGDYESEDLIRDHPEVRSGDFYNVTGDRRPIEASFWFSVSRAGTYRTYVRTMAQRKHCSNITAMHINGGDERKIGANGTDPYVWLWHFAGTARLKKGLNHFTFNAYQDGVRVDHVIFLGDDTPAAVEGTVTYTGGYAGDCYSEKAMEDASLSVAWDTLSIKETTVPKVSAWIRKNIPGSFSGRLIVSHDMPDGGEKRKEIAVEMEPQEEVRKLDCGVNLPADPPRREYLVRLILVDDSGGITRRNAVLIRGYDWQILGPLPFMDISEDGEVEEDDPPPGEYSVSGKTYTWQRYEERFTGQFGLLDFATMYTGDSYSGPELKTLYAYTEVDCPKAGEYMMKVQGDDNLIGWVNGKRVVTIDAKGPPIRTACEVAVQLGKGRNRILLRVNQKETQWQAGLRIRGSRDGVVPVTGIPFENQTAR